MTFLLVADSPAFTITEVIVSISVIGLLMSLIVPAVQSARASARLVECRNHLKQLGLAIHVVQDSKQVFSCEFGVLLRDGMGTPDAGGPPVGIANSGLFNAELQCPSDPNAMMPNSGNSYLMSNGTWNASGVGYFNLGFVTESNPHGEAFRRSAEFSDGLSQTAAFSEQAIFIEADQLNPQDDPKKHALWISTQMTPPSTAQQFVDLCRSPGNSPFPLVVPQTDVYTHLFTPNTRGCWNNTPVSNAPSLAAYMPANSFHTGGVSVLFVDGHVSFVSDSVDAKVWQAIGTIHGNEAIDCPF